MVALVKDVSAPDLNRRRASFRLMDRRSVFRLAAGVLGAPVLLGGLSGCMEPPKNDGRMFQRWAEAVADIPVTDEEAFARAGQAAPASLQPASIAPERKPLTLPSLGLAVTSESVGLRAPLKVAVVDPLDMPSSRDLALRPAMDRSPAPRLIPASIEAPVRAAAARGAYAAQLASFRTRADAEAAWSALARTHGDLMTGVTPRFESVDLGARGTWVRLKAAGLQSPAAAQALCRAAGVTDPWCAKG